MESTEKGSVKGISLPLTCTVLSVVLYKDCHLTEGSFLQSLVLGIALIAQKLIWTLQLMVIDKN